MPSHNHSATLSLSGLSTSSAGAHTHNLLVADSDSSIYNGIYPVCDNYADRPMSTSGGVAAAGGHTHTISGSGSVTVNSNGSGSAHENRPPYYALCFIMKQ